MGRPQVPGQFRAHAAWVGGLGMVVYVTEHRRRRVGIHVALLGVVMTVILALSDAPPATIVAAMTAMVAGGLYAYHGKAGFYLVRRDGQAGVFLGRTRPNLGDMRRVKLP